MLLPSRNSGESATRVTAHTYESLGWSIVVIEVSVKMGGVVGDGWENSRGA